MLSESERARLAGIEAGLRRDFPMLDRVLSDGDPGELSSRLGSATRTRALAVLLFAVLGCVLTALGLRLSNAVPIVVGVYVVALSVAGPPWLPPASPRSPR